ncbi:beta strand repeat-containing protein [Aquirufa antheringensis]|uniref:beta strand repeat-containing protein n=1 Tax=Aquirufa antheringensis TaxID=2516559 RepID=UPI00208F00F7|nr:hypothetical protein [Aquirufa antheringensis]USQ03654.1 hypothetical protein G9X63_05880 [Aquirufa antheringensis]
MKKLLLFLLLLVSVVANAQKGISYQAVVLDPASIELPGSDITGQPLVNGNVAVKFVIISGTNIQFEEVQQTKTDAYGLVNLTIGSVASTIFNSLSWDANQKTLQVFVSFDNGASYTKVSDQKLTYSPYALFAETAGKLSTTLGITGGGTGATTAVGARANLGLGNVDNTADVDKPISTATQAALDQKANVADVNAALDLKASAAMLAAHMAITVDTSMLATKAALSDLNSYAPIASPTFTGIARAATASPRTNSTQIATTAYADAAVAAATASSGVADNSITTAKIANSAVTDAKIASVAGNKITGVVPIESGGTGQRSVGDVRGVLGLSSNNVAIGSQAGTPNQGVNANTIAIGGGAGRGNQGGGSVAIGYVSGDQNQGANSVSIGSNTAQSAQASQAVALGFAAGQYGQGQNAVAIGSFAGNNAQVANSIALNATGASLNPTNAGFYVNPIRSTTATSNVLYYNSTTKEVTSGTAPSGTSGTSITAGTISTTSNPNGLSITDGVLNLSPANATNGGVVTTGSQTFAGAKTFSSDLSISGKLGLGTATPNAESSVDIATALPLILPKMDQSQVNAISTPVASMLQFNTSSKKMQVYKESIASTSSVFGNTTLSNGATCLRGSGELWFRPTISGTITQIELNAFGAGEVASIVVNSNYSGASPSPVLLGTSNSLTAVDGWNTWTFATPVPVVANTTYFITSTDANRCLGVRWSNSGDDTTTGNVSNYGFGNPLDSYDPASRITVVVPASNGWVNLRDDVATTNLSTEVTNVLPLANGGTGSSIKNFVDLSSTQTVAGTKSFSGNVVVGAPSGTGSSAALEVKSTTQGLLLPRLTTTQRDAIAAPLAAGLLIYNSTAGKVQVYAEAEGTPGTLAKVGTSPSGLGVSNDYNICLSFTPSSNWRISSASVGVQSIAVAGNMTFSIYSGVPGTGILLGAQTVATSTLSGGVLSFNFINPVEVPQGNCYWKLTADNTAYIFLPQLGQFNDGINQSFTALRNDNSIIVNIPSYSFPFSMAYTPLIGSWNNLH